MTYQEKMQILDPNEAPAGFVAVLKPDVRRDDNLCRACDWRPQCNDPSTDFTAPGNRCMGHPVQLRDGRILQRNDGCSVVFHRPTGHKES